MKKILEVFYKAKGGTTNRQSVGSYRLSARPYTVRANERRLGEGVISVHVDRTIPIGENHHFWKKNHRRRSNDIGDISLGTDGTSEYRSLDLVAREARTPRSGVKQLLRLDADMAKVGPQ